MAVLLVLTVAYLFVYLGYYTPIIVRTKSPEFADALIAYKGLLFSFFAELADDISEFDEEFDNVPKRYKDVCTDYGKQKVACGIFDDFDSSYTEGTFKIGVLIESKDELLEGYKLDKLPSAEAAI